MSRRLRFLIYFGVLIAGAGRAGAQTIIVGQPQLNFAASPGGNSTVLTLPLQVTGNVSIPYLATFTPTNGANYPNGGNFLFFSPAFGNLPSNLLLLASATNLTQGTYTGVLTITAPAATNSPINLPVTFSVGQTNFGSVIVSPSALTFVAQLSGSNPPPQLISVNTFASPYTFSVSSTTANSGNWLSVTPTSGTGPAVVAVSASTQGLATGYYYAIVTFTPAVGIPVNVPVTLIITTSPTLNFSTSMLQFYYQVGGLSPGGQNITIYGDPGTSTPFSLAPATSNGTNWLNVSPVSSNAPQTVSVSVNPTGLAVGSYVANIAVATGASQTAAQNIAVTLTVSTGTLLTLGTPPPPFNYTTGGTVPPSQSVLIDSTSGNLDFTVTPATAGGNWLTVGPLSGTTPQTLAVGVNPVGLAAGVYAGLVTVTAPGAVNTPQVFPVTLNVNTVQTLSAAPSSLNFNYQIGTNGDLGAQSLRVNTTLPAVVGVAASTTNCGNWLAPVAPTISAPGNLIIAVSTSGLTTQQVCSGTITLTLGNQTVQVPVTLNVSRSPLLNVTPTSLDFTIDYNADFVPPQNINLTTTDGSNIQFFAATGLNSPWLTAVPSNGTAPTTVKVGVYGGTLPPGKYTGAVVFTSAGLLNQQTVSVNLTIRAATTAFSNPAALTFTQSFGSSIPPAQQVTISTGTGNFPFTITPSTSGGLGWLKVAPVGGKTPANISISVVPGNLPVGTYNGSLLVSVPGASNDPLVVPVTLAITQVTGITAKPASLNFVYQLGSLFNPGDQLINVGSTGAVVPYTVGYIITSPVSGNWLAAKPAAGTTPGAVTVSVNPSSLAAGSYTGQVSITAPGIVGSPLIVPVTLTVQTQPLPVISTVTNAASGASGPISAGEIVTLKGTGMGPSTGLGPVLTADGKVETTVAFTRAFFDGFPAAILYTSSGQINTVVPYEISGRPTIQVQVENQGLRSQALTVSTISAAPGIFTVDSTGIGQGAILNQDSTPNSVTNPAGVGSVVQIFATGEGQTLPLGIDGSVAGATLPKPVLPVTAKVDDIPVVVLYAGAAPQSVAGLFQVNVKLPDGLTGDNVKVEIKVGDAPTQKGVTLAIR